MGITKAWSLVKVAWFPKPKVTLQGQRLSWLLVRSSRLWISSTIPSEPITVLEAPKSSTPWDPCDAKHACMSVMSVNDRGWWTCRIVVLGFSGTIGLTRWLGGWCFRWSRRRSLAVIGLSTPGSFLKPHWRRRSLAVPQPWWPIPSRIIELWNL